MVAVLMIVTASAVWAQAPKGTEADVSPGGVLAYVVGILFNIGVVAGIRKSAADKGKKFLQSGRFALFVTFALCFIEQLVVGKFAALESAPAFIALCQQAWIMAAAVTGTHALGKTAGQALKILPILLVGLLMCGFCGEGLCQPMEPLALTAPVVQYAGIATQAPLPGETNLLVDNSPYFSAAYAKSFKTSTDGMIGQFCMPVLTRKIATDLTGQVTLELNAIPVDGKTKFALGAGVKLIQGVFKVGVGVTKLPEPYEWSFTVSAAVLTL